tara:strand:- start:129 stop:584 length:456 start_codon:yes stop_codon:yes gene_type:complete
MSSSESFLNFFDTSKINSSEVVWLAIFVSAFFILYLSPINFFYANLIILQLLLLFFVYKFNKAKTTEKGSFNAFSVLGVIVLQILYLINNVNVLKEQSLLSFITKTTLLLAILLFSSQSDDTLKTISNTSLFILVFWFLFDQNSMSFNYQD